MFLLFFSSSQAFSLDFSHQCSDQEDTTEVLIIRQQIYATVHLCSIHFIARDTSKKMTYLISHVKLNCITSENSLKV